nr:hypothetical protein [Gracilibacillus halophilus]
MSDKMTFTALRDIEIRDRFWKERMNLVKEKIRSIVYRLNGKRFLIVIGAIVEKAE